MQESASSIRSASDPALILLDPKSLALVHASRRVREALGLSDTSLHEMTLDDIVLHPSPAGLRTALLGREQDADAEISLAVRLRGDGGRTIPAELLLIRYTNPEPYPLAAIVCFGVAPPAHGARLEPGDVPFVDFAGRLGHDLNNLLSTVIGSLGLIREDILPASNDGGYQLADDALSASRECADLVDRLMTAAGKQLLRPQRVAANSIIRRLTPLLEHTLPENIDLQVSLDPALPELEVDPDRLESAILDLVVNAREAMCSGGTLTISSGVGSPTDAPHGNYVQITVSDAGLGIPEGVRDRVLEPLFTTKSSGIGRGLGLSMVNGFVQQSNGVLIVESVSGQGTRVTLNFPPAA
jgi:nitrogen-specific signal transduction histidine kinase